MGTTLLRIGGTGVGALLGFVTGVWEVFTSPLYAGRVPLPVAPVLAVAANLAVVWFTYFVTGRRGLALLPAVPWLAVMFAGMYKTRDGDLPIPSSVWMGLITVLLGGLAWGVAGYRLFLTPGTAQPPGVPAQGAARPALPAEGAAGSGARPARQPGARPARPGNRPSGRRPGGTRGR
jgi:hypothetical protein